MNVKVNRERPQQLPVQNRIGPKRGLFLDLLLLFGVIGLATKLGSIVIVLAHLNTHLLISPSSNPAIDIPSSVMLAVALLGIWRWKKWGAYLIFARLAFTIIVQLFIYHSLSWQLIGNYTGIENVIGDLLGVVLWFWAFSRKWSYFK